MPRIEGEKKKAESSDGKQGRTSHQKLKSYIVMQYLLKNTDEDHPVSANDIIDYLDNRVVSSPFYNITCSRNKTFELNCTTPHAPLSEGAIESLK